MSVAALSVNVLTTIARSMVVTQEYASVEEALQAMALSEARRKVTYYRRRIRALECKYDTDFETFSAQLRGRATPAEEDDWMAWRSANRMLADWQTTYEELQHAFVVPDLLSVTTHPHHFHDDAGDVGTSPLHGDPSGDLPYVLAEIEKWMASH